MVSSAVALIVVTNYCIVKLVGTSTVSATELLAKIWPIALPSTVAVVLVMSTLYHVLMDVLTELETSRCEALENAQRDDLTGLTNRLLFQERLEEALIRYRTTGERFSVIMLDLDHFKRVNDVHGHLVGDKLLREAAARLGSLVRETDTIARFGGDEFLILQAGLLKSSSVRRLCSRICEQMQIPYRVSDREMTLPVSVGAVVANKGMQDPSDYIRAADSALYEAKASGRNCYRFFSDELETRLKRRDVLECELRKALQNGQGLAVHFQPQINANGNITGVESLFRWTHDELGAVPAGEAVDIAEESGLIQLLGEYVFREAARFARLRPDLSVAINVSPCQFFRTGDFGDSLRQIMFEEGVSPEQIEIEVTEQWFMRPETGCEEHIKKLRDHGFRIALDDFGTGYSSLSYLRRFKVDRLKLDRSFATSAVTEENVALVRAAVTLAHLFGIEVVAGGIETELQEAVALEAGCDALQGYRYAEAMTAGAFDLYAVTNLRSAA